ncbi:MAG TPA: OmpA family protein, partial [Bacteroidetes bacterium]|nr:OmpA family protein [Bacteroidota bacterium]
SEHLDLRVAKKYREVVRDLALVPLESGAVVVLSNLFFDEGESTLRDVSRTELSRLVKIMKSNPSMIIEIGGHTDNVGTFENNQKLSLERADAVQKVLLEADIPAKRIQTKGYGEVQPRGPNNSPESRQRNRRVEFKVLEI